jgi:hypothetical protein
MKPFFDEFSVLKHYNVHIRLSILVAIDLGMFGRPYKCSTNFNIEPNISTSSEFAVSFIFNGISSFEVISCSRLSNKFFSRFVVELMLWVVFKWFLNDLQLLKTLRQLFSAQVYFCSTSACLARRCKSIFFRLTFSWQNTHWLEFMTAIKFYT